MLGIYPSQLVDEEMVSKLNLPVNTGVQIGGVVEGLGAEAAGLQNDDVIFSLNNYLLKDYTDFAHAVADVNAGDVVEVVFYRKDHKHVVNMELSRRPSPEVPESADALSQQVARSYQEFDTQLDEVFSGVTDTQASYRPGSKEWSAKETLVHLLYTERWLHLAISCAVADQRMGGFVNQLELIKAIADSYTLPDLITELKKCEQLTVNPMASLPDEFVADKRRYINFVSSFGQGFAKHSQSHLLQIQSALSAAENQ
jgi:predicted transcriptional regulator